MLLDELDWTCNGHGGETAVHIASDNDVFLAMRKNGVYFLYHYQKSYAIVEPAHSWVGVDALSAQCVLYEVFK